MKGGKAKLLKEAVTEQKRYPRTDKSPGQIRLKQWSCFFKLAKFAGGGGSSVGPLKPYENTEVGTRGKEDQKKWPKEMLDDARTKGGSGGYVGTRLARGV